MFIAARAFSSSTQHHLSPLDDGAGFFIPKCKDVSFDLAVLIAAGRRTLFTSMSGLLTAIIELLVQSMQIFRCYIASVGRT